MAGQVLSCQRVKESGFDPESPVMKHLFKLVGTLLGFPRHLSQHTGGFVISRGPLSELVPVENASMPDRAVIQWDKDDLDALGLLKVDVLALGMLTAIRRALALVSARRGQPFGLADVPKEVAEVYDMIGHGDTVGLFQIESRAQIGDAATAQARELLRPGDRGRDCPPRADPGRHGASVSRAGVRGLEPSSTPSPASGGRGLKRTPGVAISQEQVVRLRGGRNGRHA